MELNLHDFLVNTRKIYKTGDSNTIALPKQWAAIGEVVIVVVKDDNTIILKKNIEIDLDVRVSQDPHERTEKH